MYKILVLAQSGFGKTFSLGNVPALKHKGLDPKETFLISVTSKTLPFPNSSKDYKVCSATKLDGNRYITNNPKGIVWLLKTLSQSKQYKNIVIDDFNYIMQDYYMEKAKTGSWDTAKEIGYYIGQIFALMDTCTLNNQNIIVLAHDESVELPDGRVYHKMKTTGKMVDGYITPEGKFDITLLGKITFDGIEKRIVREFVTTADETSSSPKSPYGMFKESNIPNDMGLVIDAINAYNND